MNYTHHVTVCWKGGFKHEYDLLLTKKTLQREQERLDKFFWVESYSIEPLTNKQKEC